MELFDRYTQLLKIYLFQEKQELRKAEEMILAEQPDIDVDSFHNISTWLWLLQRQFSYQVHSDQLLKIDDTPYLNYIKKEWNTPHRSIWETEQKDTYLSNLSMGYAALLETKMSRNKTFVQKTMTEMRDFIFDHMLSGGAVLSGKMDRTISVDQLLAVFPYGLFSPEDLIIVEAVQQITIQLKRSDGFLPYVGSQEASSTATALVALYYLEKSDYEKAQLYADLIGSDNGDELTQVLLEIYNHFSSNGSKNEDRIIHEPLGNENVYIPKLTERRPHFPAQDETLKLSCQIQTDETIESVKVHIRDEHSKWNQTATLTNSKEKEIKLYKTNIDPLPNHGQYHYHFVAKLINGKKITSKEYKVSTLKKNSVSRLNICEVTDNQVLCSFGDENDKYGIVFSLTEGALNLTVKSLPTGQVVELQPVNTARLDCGPYSLKINSDHVQIRLFRGEQEILSTHPLVPPIEYTLDVQNQVKEWTFHWYSPKHEQFFGFGERYNALNQRGNVVDCYVYNQYRDQGTRTYMPVPFYMTNSGYGCYIDTDAYTKFDIASELSDKCSVSIENISNVRDTNLHFFLGDYKNQLKSYVQKTGKPKMVPAWALGPWMSSNNWDRQSTVNKEVEATFIHAIPATVIVLEQWSDEATYYMFNDAEYELKEPGAIHQYDEMYFPEWGRWPDPKGMVEYLHNKNLKLLLWQIPIQKYLNKQKHLLKDQDEAYMIEKGYVVKNQDGSPYRIPENWFTNSLLMDFSHKEGADWWFKKRQYLIDMGVDGFKTDGGEFVFGRNVTFADGRKGNEMRNKYPNDYIEAYYQFAQQNGGITFSRAGYTGAQNFPAHWAGDERSTFGAFKRSLIAGLNSGLAGITFWGWDLAGFNGDIPTAELFMRSSAMAAFCPIMQYHAESKAEFNQDRTPWNIANRTCVNEVIEVYRFYANVRMNLMPYLYQEAEKSCKTGIPMMRAMMLDYPEDEQVLSIFDQYLFGDSFLVSPIIEEGSTSRMVYLPEGVWTNLWSNQEVIGPALFKVDAEVNELPVFVKSNTALLLNVNDSNKLGSSVGNNITTYHKPLCKIYCKDDFTTNLFDHLGHEVKLSVTKQTNEIIIEVETTLQGLEFEVVNSERPIRVIQ
ncbi:glycoside hydrolase family 31 protein [Bacillaceae bacterium S4-13-56]